MNRKIMSHCRGKETLAGKDFGPASAPDCEGPVRTIRSWAGPQRSAQHLGWRRSKRRRKKAWGCPTWTHRCIYWCEAASGQVRACCCVCCAVWAQSAARLWGTASSGMTSCCPASTPDSCLIQSTPSGGTETTELCWTSSEAKRIKRMQSSKVECSATQINTRRETSPSS